MRKLKSRARKPQVPHCSWCRASLQDGRPTWYILMISKFDLSPKGQWIELELLGEKTQAFILGEDSPARKDDWEMAFLACSQNCLDKLHVTFKQGKEALLQSSLSWAAFYKKARGRMEKSGKPEEVKWFWRWSRNIKKLEWTKENWVGSKKDEKTLSFTVYPESQSGYCFEYNEGIEIRIRFIAKSLCYLLGLTSRKK